MKIRSSHGVGTTFALRKLTVFITHRLFGGGAIRNNSSEIFAAYPGDWIGTNLFLFGHYERDIMTQCLDLIRKLDVSSLGKSTALDCGAYIGTHSTYFASQGYKVMAFEPNPSAFKLLQLNTGAFEGIEAFQFALADKELKAQLSSNPRNLGNTSIVHAEESEGSVEMRRLDSLKFQKNEVAFIKIDVEGYEDKVLKGGKNLIEEHLPPIIFEASKESFQGKSAENEAIRFLRNHGYEIFQTGPTSGFIGLLRTLLSIGARSWRLTKCVSKRHHVALVAVHSSLL